MAARKDTKKDQNKGKLVEGEPREELPPGYARNDEQVRKDVLDALDALPGVTREQFIVTVDDGNVHVQGTVPLDDGFEARAGKRLHAIQGVDRLVLDLLPDPQVASTSGGSYQRSIKAGGKD